MLLDSISSPADLRRLSYPELEALAVELREFIVEAVSANGGHLGSNLGAVELTLALHRVFDSPRDILLWDTGHQSYVHKVVTGRRHAFTSLRQAGGLSGYPSRDESEHDWIENSHASTILSYAHGIATAVERKGEPRRVVAVLGDGALTGGMAYEGLNNLGHSGRNVIIVLNDNGRSYAPTVSRLSESLARIRLNPTYMRRQRRFEHLLSAVPVVGEHLEKGVEGAKAAVREIFEPTAFFEPLGVRYAGPIDGHDIEGVESALRQAAEFEGPIVVHLITQKGRGYKLAEDDPVKCLHDMSECKPGSYTAAFGDALIAAAEADPTILAITAAMPDSTGLLPFAARFPDRVLDVGIAEQHAVTAAAGMAMGGLRPVVAIYSTFLTRAFDQVNLDVGLHGQPVVFCLDRAGITGDDGPSHHGILDLALLSKVPGMTIFAPSSYQELEVMLTEALSITTGPSVLRWPKTAARQVPADQVGRGRKARQVVEGDGEVAILAVGKMVAAAEEAAELLGAQGKSATVWDVRVAKPLDPDMLADAARHALVVTAEDGIMVGGIGSQIVEGIAERTESRQSPPVLVLGVPAEYLPHGKPDRILAELGLDGPGIAAATAKALAGAHHHSLA
ncbi:MAG: 1-deoxy-D-xylulose-5-phosphate synthase [Actinomycetota bacterium]|nr:1-deoxy-D-xylulose-5-phosphate synthase [Actinomycetota bacterium]